MKRFDPRSAVSGERSEGSDDASEAHGVDGIVFGRFRRAILEMRARSVLRTPSCPTATILDVAPLLNAGALLARLAGVATSRDSVATAAPVSVGLLPVAPAIDDPRVAHATGISPDSVGARAVAALARVRSASVESLPPAPIPVAIPVRRGNDVAGPRVTRGNLRAPPAVAPLARQWDPKPDHPARETRPLAAERDSAARIDSHLRPARGMKRVASAPTIDGCAKDVVNGGGKGAKSTPKSARLKSVSDPISLRSLGPRGTKGRGTTALSLSDPDEKTVSSSEPLEDDRGGREPSQAPRVPPRNLRGASFDESRWRFDETVIERGRGGQELANFPHLTRSEFDAMMRVLSSSVDAQATSEAARAAAWCETPIAPSSRRPRPSLAVSEPMDPLGAERNAPGTAFGASGDPPAPANGWFLDTSVDPPPVRADGDAGAPAEPAGARAYAVAPDPDDWIVFGDLA
jgi:hypothetical protein